MQYLLGFKRLGHNVHFVEPVEEAALRPAGVPLARSENAAYFQRVMADFGMGQTSALLLRYDGNFYRLWADRARASLGRAGLHLSRDARRTTEQLFGNYDRVVERLLELPVTFLHGEFYASNVLVCEEGAGWRVCSVDWEMAAVGPGLIDLAALTAGGWTADEREELALAYYTALVPCGNWPPAPDAFLAALDYCRLHLSVQWLGWSPDWTPPSEHAHDWLGEALGLAEKLRLA